MMWNMLLAAALLPAGADGTVPELWKTIPVCGKTFYNANVGPHRHMFQLWDNYADDPLFENVWFECAGPFLQNDAYFRRTPDGATLAPQKGGRYLGPGSGDEVWTNFPARVEDVIASWGARGKWFDEFERRRPGGPITVPFYGSRPPFTLKETFDTDPASVDAWKRKHPGFVGFGAYDEYDNGVHILQTIYDGIADERSRRRIHGQYPRERFHEIRRWGDLDYRKLKSFHFGSSDLSGLWSIWPSQGFEIARHGVRCLWYEAEMGSTSSPWRWGGAYARGASRQFRTPLGWYTAQFTFNTCLRDGSRPKDLLVDGISVTRWPWVGNRTQRKYLGAARSLMKRNEAYGYFIGCVAEMLEAGSTFLTAFTEAEPDKVILSPYGEDFREIFAWNKAHDRGTPYTPVALLVSLDEPFDRQSWKVQYNHDPVSQTAFMTTLCRPGLRDAARCTDEKRGQQGCLWNSEFGEIADVLCADSGQRSDDFLAILSCYRCAFLVGWLNPEHFDRRALVEYVRRGGLVYAERRHVEAGLVPESVDGARGRIVVVESFLPERLRDPKVPQWEAKVPEMYSGETRCPVIERLLRQAQEAYLPVRVEGDIQWGVNFVEGVRGQVLGVRDRGRWLVWLINNRGVTKFLAEPEELDPKATSHVKVLFKPTGKTYEVDVSAGQWATIEILL